MAKEEKEKALLSFTPPQLQEARAIFKLAKEEHVFEAKGDAARKELRERIVRKKIEVIFGFLSQEGKPAKLPFAEKQLAELGLSEETCDFYKQLGEKEKYQGMTVEELLNPKRERPEKKKRETPFEKLDQPEFWQELEQDLNLVLNGEYTFAHFMQWMDPVKALKQKPLQEGKYSQFYGKLYTHLYLISLRKPGVPSLTTREKITQVFFNKAPGLIKGLLLTKFPRDFGRFQKEFQSVAERVLSNWEKQGILKEILPPLLRLSAHLTPDRQEKVLAPLASYLTRNQRHNRPETLQAFLKQTIRGFQAKDVSLVSGEIRVESLLQDFSGLSHLKNEAQKENLEAKELLKVVEDEVFIPAFISAVYKPSSLFWNMYFAKDKGSREAVAESLDGFIVEFLEKRLTTYTPEFGGNQGQIFNPGFGKYFKERVLPKVRSHFQNIVLFYPEISFFQELDSQGKPKYLFLHQVEGIKRLMEQEGGILADEPGTGKTLILALAALNLIERKGEQKDTKGRILVVGNKSVVDNWENEIRQHLIKARLEIVNVNTPPRAPNAEEKLKEQTRLIYRLRALKRCLSKPNAEKQIFLVNYDLFRNPYFQQILKEHPFDALIVDEAHHVKSRDISLVKTFPEGRTTEKKNVAQRTLELYRFIRENPEMRVFLATSTPYVKEIVEPLILANLVAPEKFDYEKIFDLQFQPEATYAGLKEIMVRRRKMEVADLPHKETKFLSIPLDSLSDEEREAFEVTAQGLLEKTGDNSFARFYALLSLESQVKLSWLKAKVDTLLVKGKKVLIFTPFVYDENRYTAPMSTVNLVRFLRKEGVRKVGVLDGSLDLTKRAKIQEQFKLPISNLESLDVLVGNYQTAGESITLCSPDNRATEVILFVCPNSISKLVQAVDRVHRFGQTENVTIHVPFVTSDILGREKGTYDERVVRRLYRELAYFNQVIDGLFFIEPRDIYQQIAREEKIEPTFAFAPSEILRLVSKEVKIGRRATDWEEELEEIVSQEKSWIRNATGQYLKEIRQYPLLSFDEEIALAKKIEVGRGAERILVTELSDPRLTPALIARLTDRVKEEKEARETLVNSNLRLVVFIAKRYQGQGLSLLDLIQAGNLGLMKTLEKYDWQKGVKFSTYAYYWIRQQISQEINNFSTTIRIPASMRRLMYKASRFSQELCGETGRYPTNEEWEEKMVRELGIRPKRAKDIVRTLRRDLTNLPSLDQYIDDEEKTTLADLIPDPKAQVAEEVEERIRQEKLEKEVAETLTKVLSEREKRVVTSHHLSGEEKRTLRAVGEEVGVTRERIRQIEEGAFEKLKKSEDLQKLWHETILRKPDYLQFSLEEKNPEEIVIGETERHRVLTPLQEAIFNLPKLKAIIAYRRLYFRLSNQEIAKELHLEEEDVKNHFDEARIELWERLPIGKYLNSSSPAIRLIYFPLLDPKTMEIRCQQNGHQLDQKTKEILENFFGFNGQKGLFNLENTARQTGLQKAQVKHCLLKGIEAIEAIPV